MNFFIIYKHEWNNLLWKKRDIILNRAKGYDKNDKEILRDNEGDKYRNLSEQEKIKRESMEKIGIIICLKKATKTKGISKNCREANKSRKCAERLSIINF